jgi:predicted exporter
LEHAAERIYQIGVRHWCVLTACIIVGTLLGVLFMIRLPMAEDVTVMLPDSDTEFVASYRLLDAAPFTRNVLIDLEAQHSDQVPLLTETVQRLTERLDPPLISRVIGNMSAETGVQLLDWLYAHLPQLFTEQDANALAVKIAPEQVAQALQDDVHALTGPEGVWLRKWLGKDPLGFRSQAFRKLSSVAMLPDARIEGGFLVDPTGRHTLLVAETPVAMGDSRGGEQLLQYLDKVISETVPNEIRAHVVCAHRYTVANARTIKRDLVTVFAVSSVALVGIFLVLLRHWRALFVFVAPCLGVLAAVLLTAALFGRISAITVGFGAVLLGISDDYGLHVFFALRRRQCEPAQAMARLAVPEAVSWATTVGVFVVLLWSGIPIQRQLAVFSIAGLTVTLGLAFLWLPHWVCGGRPNQWLSLPSAGNLERRWIGAVWLVLTVALLPVCFRVQFDGDLRKVGVVPKDVLADEHCIRDVWADPRGRGLVVVQSDDVESALRTNEEVYAQLADFWAPGQFVSLAPLLPSRDTQLANLARWKQFWKEPGRLEQLKENLSTQGRKLHFVEGAFDPFLQGLQKEHEPFTIAQAREVAGPLLEPFLLQRPEGLGLINLVPDDEQTAEAFSASGLNLPPGVQTVSQRRFASILRHSLEGDFRRFLLVAMIAVVVVLAVILRRIRQVILSLLPAITGLEVMLAIMALSGMRVNLFNVAASVLVIGLSIDYGVFMACRSGQESRAIKLAVVTSALTTISGFGALSLARHPAMFSLGITVVLGIIPAMICALVVVPALRNRGPAS